MAAGNTYVALATNTLSSTAASVTFSSISGAYTDLVVVSNVSTTLTNINFIIRFNSDSAANYSWTSLGANTTIATSNYVASTASPRVADEGYLTTTIGTYVTSIQNYSNTTTYKTYLSRANGSTVGVGAVVGLWRSTAAINAITLLPASSTFISGSTFQLFGIAAA